MDDKALELRCPSCGAPVAARLRYAKLVVCEQCQTPLFLEDEAVAVAGERSVLAALPSLLRKGERYRYRARGFEPVGRARFDYGDGLWDEWWVVLDDGGGRWLSVDEGEFAVEAPLEIPEPLPSYESLALGAGVRIGEWDLTVTERNEARCLGVEGELPEPVLPGQSYRYAHLSGPRRRLVTLEFDRGARAYSGVWLDPFEVIPETGPA